MSNSFTLIEILVVIVVVGILSSFILVGMSSITNSANIAKGQAFANSMRNSLLIDLVSEWKLDDGSGTQATTKDYWSTNNGNLTNFVFNTTDGWRTGSSCTSGGCLLFNGINGYVALPESTKLKTDDITLELWINPIIVTNGSPIRTTITNKFYLAFHSDGGFAWHVRKSDNVGSYLYSNITVTTNKWHHIVATHKTLSFQRFYIDGVRVADASDITWSPLVVAGNYGWVIGGSDWSVSSAYYKGLIDDVRFYDDAISISQIQQNYYLGINKLYKNNGIGFIEFNQRLVELKSNLANN